MIVWKLKDDKLRQFRRYKLNDPYIFQKIHYGSQIDKIIHKTHDGVAYVYYKDYEDYKGATAAIKIGVLDQTWPESDKLPFQVEKSDRLNSQITTNYPHGLNHAIARNLKKTDSDFIGKYYNSVQFFNDFTFLAHSTLGLTSRVTRFKRDGTMRVT